MTDLKNIKLGVALCGSFCTFKQAVKMIQDLVDLGADVYPIMSFNAYNTSTRFGKAEDFIAQIESITGKSIIHTIVDAEPLGPKNLIDAVVVAPCTGNTLSKMANAIIDTPVVLAAKALMRNSKPVILAISTNDGLGLNMKNIGELMPIQNIYFVPFGQDNCVGKPYSLIADLNLVPATIEKALEGKQIQPLLITY
ncbi:MAG: dipicolinate synthase subunit B [Cellulosilyticaceae bacterium]